MRHQKNIIKLKHAFAKDNFKLEFRTSSPLTANEK